MTSAQVALTVLGFTHASSVIPLDSCSDAASGIVTAPFAKLSAPPNLPAVVRVTPVPNEPVLLLLDASAAVAPLVSSKLYAATSPLTCAADFMTVSLFVAVPVV